jgi:D-alanyl-D-alanine carboxypeptidase
MIDQPGPSERETYLSATSGLPLGERFTPGTLVGGRFASSRRSAAAGWERLIAPTIRSSVTRWRASFCLDAEPSTRQSSIGCVPRCGLAARCRTRTYAASTTSASPQKAPLSPWSTSTKALLRVAVTLCDAGSPSSPQAPEKPQGVPLAQRGLVEVFEIFNRNGWYWGAEFSGDSVDSMHFEWSEESVSRLTDGLARLAPKRPRRRRARRQR